MRVLLSLVLVWNPDWDRTPCPKPLVTVQDTEWQKVTEVRWRPLGRKYLVLALSPCLPKGTSIRRLGLIHSQQDGQGGPELCMGTGCREQGLCGNQGVEVTILCWRETLAVSGGPLLRYKSVSG